MTMSVMAVSSDIPFESEEEVATRLARYEKLFSNRYTEDDDWYAGTCQRTGRYMYWNDYSLGLIIMKILVC